MIGEKAHAEKKGGDDFGGGKNSRGGKRREN